MKKTIVRLLLFLAAALFITPLPVYATEPTINYTTETITGLTKDQEFSLNNSTWFSILEDDTVITIASLISTTKTTWFYYRSIGATRTETQALSIPPRPPAPTGVKFVPRSDPTEDTINLSDDQQYKVGNSVWLTAGDSDVLTGKAEAAGTSFSVRVAATEDSFASAVATIKIPKQAAAPTTPKYNMVKDSIPVTNKMEYLVSDTPIMDWWTAKRDNWIPVKAKQTMITRSHIAEALDEAKANQEVYVYVRTKVVSTGSAIKGASAIAEIRVPKIPASPNASSTAVRLEIASEKLKGVSSKMEYRLLTTPQQETATYSTPAWKAITGSEVNLSKAFSATAAKNPKTMIQVRYKPIKATTGKAAQPGSQPVEFLINARPKAPVLADVAIDYQSVGAETIAIPDEMEFAFGNTTTWISGGSDYPIGNKIPTTGTLAVQVRVKAVAGIEYTPSSAVFKKVKIAARPKSPNAVFNNKTKKITKVNAKMEYAIGSDDWEAVTGNKIDLSGQDAGTLAVKIRLKPTDKKPASSVQSLSCTIAKSTK